MWLRLLHSIGLTNLSDEQVKEYTRLRHTVSEFSQANQIWAALVLLVSLGGYVATVYLAYHSNQEKAKQANAQAADRILQNAAKVDEQLAKIQASLSEINQKQIPSPVKDKIAEISQQVVAIGKANNKTKSKAKIDKFANSKDFQVGAIVTPEGAKVYKPEQRDEFVRDAGQFIDTHPIDRVGSKQYDFGEGECVEGNGACISILSQSNLRSELGARVEVIFADRPIRVASALKALGDDELAASFASSDEPLCRWLHHVSGSTALAERAPSPLVSGRLPKR